MHAEIEAAVRHDPAQGLEMLIDEALHATERNPIVGVALSEEGLAVLRALPEAQREAFVQRDARLVERVLVVLDEAGVSLAVPPAALVGLLRALVMVGWHRRDVDEDLLGETVAWLVPVLRAAMLAGSGGDDA